MKFRNLAVDGHYGTHLLKEEIDFELCKWKGCTSP